MTREIGRKVIENSFRDWLKNGDYTDIYVIALVSSFEEYSRLPGRGKEPLLLREAEKTI